MWKKINRKVKSRRKLGAAMNRQEKKDNLPRL